MCRLFIGARNDLWDSSSKSLRIDGFSTSIRMENFFWHILEIIAQRDGMTTNQLITKLYYEAQEAEHDLTNFTSFLRVCCGRYLSLTASGDISRSPEESLREVDAEEVLRREQFRYPAPVHATRLAHTSHR